MVRYLVAISLAAGIALSQAPAARASDAASLLSLHANYAGWHFGAYSTLVIKGEAIDSAGRSVGHWRTLEIGAAYRTQSANVPGMLGDSGFTGRVFWSTDANGFTRPNYSDYQSFEISKFVLFNEGTSLLSGTSEGDVGANGTSYPVVRVTPENGDPIDLAVDPSTGAYVQAVIDPGGPYERTYDILGYTEFAPGKRYVSKYRVNGAAATNTVTQVQANVPVDSVDLHPPAATAYWTFGSAQPVRVRMTQYAAIVQATINGVSGNFIIDTGASDIVLSSDFASRAHVNTGEAVNIEGLLGPLHAGLAHVAMTIGDSTLNNVLVAVGGRDYTANANEFHDELGTITVNGLIGYPLFGAAVVTLNTSDRTLTIEDPQQAVVDQTSGWAAHVDLADDQPMIPVLVEHRAPINALLDSGNSAFVAISQGAVDRNHIAILGSAGTMPNVAVNVAGINPITDPNSGVEMQNYMASHEMIRDITGQEEIDPCSTISSIALGPINYESTTACVSQHMAGDWLILGYPFLENFDLTFDYPQGILLFKPHTTH